MDTLDAIGQAIRAAVNARFPRAREHVQAGNDRRSAELVLESADVGSKKNRKLIAEALEALDFPPRGPAVWQMHRLDDLRFDLLAWRSF